MHILGKKSRVFLGFQVKKEWFDPETREILQKFIDKLEKVCYNREIGSYFFKKLASYKSTLKEGWINASWIDGRTSEKQSYGFNS